MTIESVRAGFYAKMNGGELVSACGQDALKWAEAFVEITGVPVDVDVAHGWFANAMMTMWDVTNSNATHDDELLLDHISALVRNRDLWREHRDPSFQPAPTPADAALEPSHPDQQRRPS